MKKLISLFSGVIATLVAAPAIAQLPFDCGQWDATEFGYGLNPPMNCPVDSCWGNLGVYGEFVYFRASEDNVTAYQEANYTTAVIPVTGLGEVSTNSFRREKFNPNYKPGYRIGVILNLPCDQWAVDAKYTYFYSKNTKNSPVGLFTDGTDTLAPTSNDPFVNSGTIYSLSNTLNLFRENNVFGALTSQVGSTWQFRFNEVDVDLTRQFYVGPAVTFRPFFGFRGLFIQQHLNSTASRIFDPTSTADAPEAYNAVILQRLTCNSDGYGLHSGSEVTFNLCKGLDIFGSMGIGLLWTHFTTQFNRVVSVYGPTSDVVNQTLNFPLNKESFDVMRFTADLSAGLEWKTLINCNQNELFVRFAWEHKIFMSLNAFRTYVDGESDFSPNALGGLLDTTGDLSLYGFSVGAGFTF